jgi:hypothetical protein
VARRVAGGVGVDHQGELGKTEAGDLLKIALLWHIRPDGFGQ